MKTSTAYDWSKILSSTNCEILIFLLCPYQYYVEFLRKSTSHKVDFSQLEKSLASLHNSHYFPQPHIKIIWFFSSKYVFFVQSNKIRDKTGCYRINSGADHAQSSREGCCYIKSSHTRKRFKNISSQVR